jgi:hypothetical protein
VRNRALQIWKKYFGTDSPFEININSNVKKTICKKLTNAGLLGIKSENATNKGDIVKIDSNLFLEAQSSIFTLMEMDSFPRFLLSDIYLKYKGAYQLSEQIHN